MSASPPQAGTLLAACLAGTWGWLLGTSRPALVALPWGGHDCAERSCEEELRRILELQAEVWWLRYLLARVLFVALALLVASAWALGFCTCCCLKHWSARRHTRGARPSLDEGPSSLEHLTPEPAQPPQAAPAAAAITRGPLTPSAKALLRQ